MQTFLTVLSIFLGVMNLIQFLASMATGSSVRARAQSSYNNWYRVAQIADQITKEPQKASELVRSINGIADAARNEIKAYCREELDLEPWLDPAWEGGMKPSVKTSVWQKIKFAFVPK
jgi:hypothetical protein